MPWRTGQGERWHDDEATNSWLTRVSQVEKSW
jgi:hypothetical protein